MRYLKYFSVQLKRTLRLAVGVFPTAMLLFACLGAAAWFLLNQGPLAERQQKYQIGVVGKIDDTYLGFGIYAIQTLDVSRFMVDFIPMTEEEARQAFRNDKITAYIKVPEDFLDSLIYGRNDVPISYVASEGQKGIGGYLMDELAVVVSKLVTSAQGSIYSFQDVIRDYGDASQLGEWTDEINLQLIENVLARTKLAELTELGLSKGLLMRQYYFCAVVLLYCFLFGISSASFFLKRNEDLGKWMKMRGIGAAAQVLCEYGVYLFMMMACVFLPLIGVGIATRSFAFLKTKVYMDEILKALVPILIMISAMHFMIYETVRNPVANLLLQFLGVIGMGYVSGYIYPASFFPKGIAFVGSVLPTGVALEGFSGAMLDERSGMAFGLGCLYVTAFLVLAVLMRKRMIERDNG